MSTFVLQVEHYLSLNNLATDQFLRSHMSASSSGMSVPLSVIAGFPRYSAHLFNLRCSCSRPQEIGHPIVRALLFCHSCTGLCKETNPQSAHNLAVARTNENTDYTTYLTNRFQITACECCALRLKVRNQLMGTGRGINLARN